MRVCDLHTGSIRLGRAAKDLREQWTDTIEYWNDANRHDFERNHLQEIAPQITLMVAAINRLSEVLEKAERELTDERSTFDD